MQNELSIGAKIFFALGADKWPKLRQIALSVAARQIMELHQYGRFKAGINTLDRLSARWKLGNFVCAMQAHYPF